MPFSLEIQRLGSSKDYPSRAGRFSYLLRDSIVKSIGNGISSFNEQSNEIIEETGSAYSDHKKVKRSRSRLQIMDCSRNGNF
jgi:hypothetical protein